MSNPVFGYQGMMILDCKDIKIINHENDATKWFGDSVEIKGGVNYFLKDSEHNGPCLFNNVSYVSLSGSNISFLNLLIILHVSMEIVLTSTEQNMQKDNYQLTTTRKK